MSFYDFTVRTSTGKEISMSDYHGRPVLVVNTATQCALTTQFEGLEELHQQFKDDGLIVIGFPCNQFMGQEPLSNEEMASTCEINYGVTFLLTEKVNVNGPKAHPIFKYLKTELGAFLSNEIKWNFTKFLVDRTGRPFKRYSPTTAPYRLRRDIKKLVAQEVAETTA
ncbi:MAG: glutathione peroxidase [Bacteroidota bacterium]